MPCQHCPCPDSCLRWPVFCRWAASGDPVKLAHIRARSAIASGAPIEAPPPTVAAVRKQLDRVNACPWLVKRSDCGCGVNWCAQYQTTTTRRECGACLDSGANS